MKLLIHAINGVGLGHIVRTSHVADALKIIRPDIDVIFVTNSKYSSFLKKKYKTYTLEKDTRAVVEGKYSYDDYLRYNSMAISKIISHENPKGVLFDCELNKDLLMFCKNNSIKTVYVLRNSTAERFLDIKSSLPVFDSVIIPHSKEDVPCDQKEFLLSCPTSFTGPILDSFIPSEETIRKNILISLGSGANIPQNLPLFSVVDSFLKLLRTENSLIDNNQVYVDIVVGPFYEGNLDFSGFTVRPTTECLARDMYHAKLVISGAGYNTINEIISTKTPAVIVPLSRRWDDQLKRAKYFEELGCI